MNTQKQITLMVLLVFLLLGGCAAYTVYDQNRENDAAAYQTEVLAERGARIFARYCRQCHGDAGQGRIGPMLDRPELRDPNTRAETQLWVTDTITCGRIGKIMPPWAIKEGGALNDEQIKDVMTLITTGGDVSGQGGHGWQKAAEFSAIENQAAPVPSVEDVLKGAAITGASSRVCGQLAPATETPAANGMLPSGVQPTQAWTEETTDNKFSVTAMAITAGQPATITVTNKGQALHNWDVIGQKDASGKDIKTSDLVQPGQTATVTFTITQPGVYKFQCDVHPTDMTGELYVVGPDGTTGGGASASASPAAGGGAPSSTLSETTTDNKYSQTAFTVPAGQEVTLTLDNKGTAIHNWDVLNVKDANGNDVKTDLVQAGKSVTYKFTIKQPGTYKFQCDVHPTEMTGTLTVQ